MRAVQCPVCRHFNGEVYDPDLNILITFKIDYIARKDYNVEDGRVGKAFKAFSMNEAVRNLKIDVQHDVKKRVRGSAARIAKKRFEGLEQIKMQGHAHGYHAAQTVYSQLLSQWEEKFERATRDKNGWELGYNAAWAEAHKLQAEQDAAFVNTFFA